MTDNNNIVDITQVKKEKISTKIVSDIDKILHIFSTAQQALSYFKQYTPVQEVISIIEVNKTLFEIHRKRHAENTTQDTDKK